MQQLAGLAKAGSNFNPRNMQIARVKAREAAFERLTEILSPRKAKKLAKIYQSEIKFSGMRELFKEHITQVYHRTRKKLIHLAESFVAADRMDQIEQIFELHIADVGLRRRKCRCARPGGGKRA